MCYFGKDFSFWQNTGLICGVYYIHVFLTNTVLVLIVKNIDISSFMCSGSYPHTPCFKRCLKYLIFVFGEVLEKQIWKNTGLVFGIQSLHVLTKTIFRA